MREVEHLRLGARGIEVVEHDLTGRAADERGRKARERADGPGSDDGKAGVFCRSHDADHPSQSGARGRQGRSTPITGMPPGDRGDEGLLRGGGPGRRSRSARRPLSLTCASSNLRSRAPRRLSTLEKTPSAAGRSRTWSPGCGFGATADRELGRPLPGRAPCRCAGRRGTGGSASRENGGSRWTVLAVSVRGSMGNPFGVQ